MLLRVTCQVPFFSSFQNVYISKTQVGTRYAGRLFQRLASASVLPLKPVLNTLNTD